MREIYRILDANANRAREALRVVEDFARFILDDAGLAAVAKGMRSRLREAMTAFPADALLAARDTPGDVGTRLTSPGELARADAVGVVTAACKRASEALRTLEEYAKVESPASAGIFEALRYQSYSLEQTLFRRLAVKDRFGKVRLYVLLTSGLCRSGDPVETARAAMAGGADCIQLREKAMPARAMLALGTKLRELTSAAGALLIVNDRADIAAACSADGVHLGQDDLPVAAARRLLAPGALVGKSTHTLDQARAAVAEGADYLGVGPMFATSTKDAGPLAGVECLRQVVGEVAIPHVAIGGITAGNVGELVAAGARRVAVCSAIIAAPDPQRAAAEIKAKLGNVPLA
jgi:thiamine-phosphate pyrophosphorylase